METPDNRPEAVLDRILEKKGLVPQNTPDTEWKEEFWNMFWLHRVPKNTKQSRDIEDCIEAILERELASRDTYWNKHEQEMYEALDKEYQLQIEHAEKKRDTYWKERVRKIYLKILKKARETDYADTTEYDECAKLLKPLLDNLK